MAAWDSVEDLVLALHDGDSSSSTARGIVHHLQVVRAELARQLWARHVFVGVTVLDELLYTVTAEGAGQPVLATLERLRDQRLDMRSLIVFPLHSFGVLAAGLLRPFRATQSPVLVNPRRRLALTPQTNRLTRTAEFINQIGPELGMRKPVDYDLLDHWRRSRDAQWLERNPLLVAGVRSITGYYYENEFLLLGRLRALTASVVMLCAMQPGNEERAADLFSSSKINNLETRDIRHYILLSDARGRVLTGRAVPIHQRRHVDELSDLPVEIDPRFWKRREVQAANVYDAVDALYDGYLRHSVGRAEETSVGKAHRKIFDAVTYFRRSSQRDWTSTISLATAFEMLLTDAYEPGVTERLRRRTENLLRGVPGTRRYQRAVVDVYNARSATVHRGEVTPTEHEDARRAFVLAFLSLMRRLPTLKPHERHPLAFLTGDSA